MVKTVPREVVVDTGPLVALLNVQDPCHELCREELQLLSGPMLTTWLAVGEAAWMLRRTRDGVRRLLALISQDVIVVEHLGVDAANWMSVKFKQYADMHPQLADLSLLYLAERYDIQDIFTLDRRDFLVYRTASGSILNIRP
jgi:predicted nucleic acid-binding protein